MWSLHIGGPYTQVVFRASSTVYAYHIFLTIGRYSRMIEKLRPEPERILKIEM